MQPVPRRRLRVKTPLPLLSKMLSPAHRKMCLSCITGPPARQTPQAGERRMNINADPNDAAPVSNLMVRFFSCIRLTPTEYLRAHIIIQSKRINSSLSILSQWIPASPLLSVFMFLFSIRRSAARSCPLEYISHPESPDRY